MECQGCGTETENEEYCGGLCRATENLKIETLKLDFINAEMRLALSENRNMTYLRSELTWLSRLLLDAIRFRGQYDAARQAVVEELRKIKEAEENNEH